MKKYLILSIILASLSYGLEIEGEIKVGASAAWGGDGIAYPSTHLKNMLKVALPRENIFDETWPYIPSFSVDNSVRNLDVSVRNSNDNSENRNANNKEKPEPIYVNSQEEADIELSKRYVSRGVQFDKTLFDGNFKIKDFGTKVGMVLKGRPNRLDQGWNLFDVNRVYFTLDVDTKPIRLNSTLYLKGYENGTPGLNRFSEDGYRDPKKTGHLDVDATIRPLDFTVTPDIDLVYSGNFKEHSNYALKPGFKVSVYSDDTNEFYISAKADFTKNKYENMIKNIDKNIQEFTPGNREVEYFKNWEIGPLILDTEYNKDKTIMGREGKAAYRYIGKRDPKLGYLSGLNGSIRSVGTPTGALYGDTFVNKVISTVFETAIDNLEKGSEIKSIADDLRAITKNGGYSLWIRDSHHKSDFFLNHFKPKAIIAEVNRLIENKNGELDNIIRPIINKLFGIIQVDNKGNLSDFHAIHLIPREFRGIEAGTLPPIPYEDSKANIKKRENEVPLPDVIVRPRSNESSITNRSSSTKYEEDTEKVEKLGSNKENKGDIYAPHDSRNAIFSTETKKIINDVADTLRTSSTKPQSILEKIKWGINIFKEGNKLFSELFYKRDQYGRTNILKPILSSKLEKIKIENAFLNKLVYTPETLSTFDMFSSLQINDSESDFRKVIYKSKYLEKAKSAENNENGYSLTYDNKTPLVMGYDITLGYNYKKAPLSIVLNNKWNIAKRETKYINSKNPYFNGETKESISKHELNFDLNYKGEQLKINTGVNLEITKNNFELLETEKIITTWDAKGFKADYSVYSINPRLSLEYMARPNKYFEIVPKLLYEGNFEYQKYGNISDAHYVKRDDKTPIEYEEIAIDVFKRDENNRLIKSSNAPKTGNKEFDDIKAGESVDLTKFSKYLITDVENSFEKEKQTGKSKWTKYNNTLATSLDLYVIPIKYVKIGYHLLIPVVFKNNSIDGFFIRNGLSVTFKF